MPFTFAHPAAVLPLGIRKNKYFDLTALILGSMAPDFEYFIHFIPYQLYGHTIFGQVFYNLPLVLVISFIYHYVLKESIIINLPNPYCRYYHYLIKNKWKIKSFKSFIVFIYSALIGMFTHLLWDSFTHRGAYFVTRIDDLTNDINILNHSIPIYKILQHLSTMVGLLIILIFLIRIQDRNTNYNNIRISKNSKIFYWIIAIMIDLIIVISVVLIYKDFSIGRIVVSLISGGFIGITLISLIFKIIALK